jgi:hypothetical protein
MPVQGTGAGDLGDGVLAGSIAAGHGGS